MIGDPRTSTRIGTRIGIKIETSPPPTGVGKNELVTFRDGRTENDYGDDYGLRRKRSFTVVVAVVVVSVSLKPV